MGSYGRAETGWPAVSRYCPVAHRSRSADPVFAAIDAHEAAYAKSVAAWAAIPDHPGEPPWSDEVDAAQDKAERAAGAAYEVFVALLHTRPTTEDGLSAYARYIVAEAATCGSTREAIPQMMAIAVAGTTLIEKLSRRSHEIVRDLRATPERVDSWVAAGCWARDRTALDIVDDWRALRAAVDLTIVRGMNVAGTVESNADLAEDRA